MLVSVVQQSDSAIHVYIFIPFQILFPIRLLQNIEQSSLCLLVESKKKKKVKMNLFAKQKWTHRLSKSSVITGKKGRGDS